MNDRQVEIRKIIEKANKAYRLSGEGSGLSDTEYDYLLSLIDDKEFHNKVGVEINRDKVSLPIQMGSLNKVKNLDEILQWRKSYDIDYKTECILTPKFDGLSLLVSIVDGQYKNAFTRGDGVTGQNVTEHFAVTRLAHIILPDSFSGYLVGEAIMEKSIFEKKYKEKFKNPRNMVAGLLNRKEISQELQDISFLAFSVYSLGQNFDKLQEVDFCNNYNNLLYNYRLEVVRTDFKEVTQSKIEHYFDSQKRYRCDGVVITLNSNLLQQQLGNQTGKFNPAWARAWKPESNEVCVAEVEGVSWQVSKQGYQKPVVHIKPIFLGGVTISNVTGINGRFMIDNGIGIGAVVSIIRAGDVIPRIISVSLPSMQNSLPELCVSCQRVLQWNENKIELRCDNLQCKKRVISANVDFFFILEIDEIGEGVVQQFYESGYHTIEQILALSKDDLFKLEGFQQKKATKVYQAIHSKLDNVPLEKIQHSSNLFKGLGTKRLALLKQYDSVLAKPSVAEIITIDGFSENLAKAYLDGFDDFWQWVKKLPVKIVEYKFVEKIGPFTGKFFVFSGFRDTLLEKQIEDLGGQMKSSVSSKTYALIIKNKNEKSSKIEKAKKISINIFDKYELQKQLEQISFN